MPIQSGLAVIGGVAGLSLWIFLSQWQWLAGSIALLANWPFTRVVIMPVNKRLMATQQREAGSKSRKMLVRWGNLHNIRSCLGVLAMLLFA
ncbi:MAG TPA: DUF1772 domain-containing protein [Allosphingosinicella sp.]